MTQTRSDDVYAFICQAGRPVTVKEIREGMRLPRRTIYTSLQKLLAKGWLQTRPSLKDARQDYYWKSEVVQKLDMPTTKPAVEG